MVSKLINYFKKILGIEELEWSNASLQRDLTNLQKENSGLKYSLNSIQNKFDELDKLTRYDVDVGVRGNCSIILTGVYKGKGYVQYYDVPYQEFDWWVGDLRQRKKYHLLRTVDMPPQFKGWFNLEAKGKR